MLKSNHHQAIAYSDTTTGAAAALTGPNSYSLVDTPTSSSLLFQQVQRPNILSQVCIQYNAAMLAIFKIPTSKIFLKL